MKLIRWNWILQCWEESAGKNWSYIKGGRAGVKRAIKNGGRVIVSETVS